MIFLMHTHELILQLLGELVDVSWNEYPIERCIDVRWYRNYRKLVVKTHGRCLGEVQHFFDGAMGTAKSATRLAKLHGNTHTDNFQVNFRVPHRPV